jgi:hypothetical protein
MLRSGQRKYTPSFDKTSTEHASNFAVNHGSRKDKRGLGRPEECWLEHQGWEEPQEQTCLSSLSQMARILNPPSRWWEKARFREWSLGLILGALSSASSPPPPHQ